MQYIKYSHYLCDNAITAINVCRPGCSHTNDLRKLCFYYFFIYVHILNSILYPHSLSRYIIKILPTMNLPDFIIDSFLVMFFFWVMISWVTIWFSYINFSMYLCTCVFIFCLTCQFSPISNIFLACKMIRIAYNLYYVLCLVLIISCIT